MLLYSHARPRRGPRPLRPREDTFHDAPAGLEDLAPGAVIRTRAVRLAFLGTIPQPGARAWQLAYRSTDLNGAPEVAVTTIVVPTRPRGILIGYQCAIDAVSDRCFPSYALRQGARALGALPQGELIFIAELLRRGHVVSICDHEGRGGHFAAPREPGHRVLDGLRAARGFAQAALPEDPAVGLIGYSGGGMATAWAAEMAPSYAPDLRLCGAVLGSPVGDPGEAFIKLNDSLFAGLPALVISGLREIYPGLADVVRRHSSATGRRRLDRLQDMSTVAAVARYAYDDFDEFLDTPLEQVLAEQAVVDLFDDLRMGKSAPGCPVLVLQSAHDQIIDVAEVDAQVAAYRALGGSVQYVRDLASEHISLMLLGMPLMVRWLEDRFTDEPIGRSRTALSVALSWTSVVGYAGLIGSVLRVATGRVR